MRSWRVLLPDGLLAVMLLQGSAWAQPAEIDIAAQSQPQPLQVKTGVAAFATEIRLSNSATEERRFRPGTLLVRAADGASQPVRFERVDAPTDSLLIAPGGEAVLRLSASLPSPGLFTTEIDILASAKKDDRTVERVERRVRIAVTREAEAAARRSASAWRS